MDGPLFIWMEVAFRLDPNPNPNPNPKQEIAHNVLDYYVHHRELLRRGVEGYSEAQGKGFICWRFVNEHMR